MFDTHIHTEFSTDSKMTIEEAIDSSSRNDLGLIITEHMDLGLKKEKKFYFDVESYFEKYNKYRNDKLLLGIELGMEKGFVKEGNQIISHNPFDYVIGSIHLIDGVDLFFNKFYDGKTKEKAYTIYFENMLNNLEKYDFIDSLGHIDYISRYAKYEEREIYYEQFKYSIDSILNTLVQKEKSMEINTRRLEDKSTVENLLKIYKRFYELGGKTVTLGSDSHNPKAIGNRLDLAKEIAEHCNLKIVYYKNRKPIYDK